MKNPRRELSSFFRTKSVNQQEKRKFWSLDSPGIPVFVFHFSGPLFFMRKRNSFSRLILIHFLFSEGIYSCALKPPGCQIVFVYFYSLCLLLCFASRRKVFSNASVVMSAVGEFF